MLAWFNSIDGEHFRQVTRYSQTRIEEHGQRLKSELPFEVEQHGE